jgi:hypothetical protein
LPGEQLTHLEEMPDFNAIYSMRLEKMDKKNRSKEEHLNKRKVLQEKL